MKRVITGLWLLIGLFLISVLALGCASTPAPTQAPAQAPKAEAPKAEAPKAEAPKAAAPTEAPKAAAPTQAPAAKEAPKATEAPKPAAPAAPKVGGKVVIAHTADPDTLDVQVGGGGFLGTNILRMLHGSLIAVDPKDGKYIPYLAESWETSADGLTWTFKLKRGVKFHNGETLTAKDWVYTVQRAQDPATKAARALLALSPIAKAEAVDDYTLKLTLKESNATFLFWIASNVAAPASKTAVDKFGAEYGRNPVGVGPYKFKEWQAGKKVVLERFADFNWDPPFAQAGPPGIETLEFIIIPEEATRLAGVEAGEIDIAQVPTRLLSRFEDRRRFQVFQGQSTGTSATLAINAGKAPFDDVKVRQALNLAVDKASLIKVVTQGTAVIQHGPLSPRDAGYWNGVEQLSYKYDAEKAKALLKEAGWSDSNNDGIVEKAGKPLAFTITVPPTPANVRSAEVLKEQYKAVGVDVTIRQVESGVYVKDVWTDGTYDASVIGATLGEADLMYRLYGESTFKMVNAKDQTLNQLLDRTRTTADPAKRQEVVNEAQKYIIEKAYNVPLYVDVNTVIYSPRVKGLYLQNTGEAIYGYWFFDAYVE